MATGVTLFRSTDTGAPALSGTVGSLLGVLDACLVINKVFSTANDSSFTDNSVEARIQAGTAFTLFPTPATTDRTYFGMARPFYNLTFDLAGGSAATYVWEYWNGSAWTAFTPSADTTSGLTADGKVTWTAGLTSGWATTTVNSVALYYVRVRFTGSNPSTNPTVNSVSALGWTRKYSGTNKAAYQQGGGVGFFLRIDDASPNGTAVAKEAQFRGYEAMSDVDTGTGPFPTVAQIAVSGMAIRKSTSADATARTWLVLCDDRTVYIAVLTTDIANTYFTMMFGSGYSLMSGDAYNCYAIGRLVNSSGVAGGGLTAITTAATTAANNYVARGYTQVGASLLIGKHGDLNKNTAAAIMGGSGQVPYPNGPDSGIYVVPMWLTEGSGTLRALMRGCWDWCHATSSAADQDTFAGAGALAGKTFLVMKPTDSGSSAAMFALETSDTWDTN